MRSPASHITSETSVLGAAARVIETTYGDIVSVNKKGKNLLKFGRNAAVGTGGAEVQVLPAGVTEETDIATNGITHISSADAGDTTTFRMEGHTISGGALSFTVQTGTLDGQNKVALTTPLARCTRLINSSGTDWTGPIYVYEDDTVTLGVPDTAAKVHLIVDSGRNQSEKAKTSISSVDYWLISNAYVSVLEKTSAFVDVRLQIKESGGVYRTQVTIAGNSGTTQNLSFDPLIIVPSNSDVRLFATASGSNIETSAGMNGYLAIKT